MKKNLGAAIAAALAMPVGAAHAQSEAVGGLEEVIVTATKRELSVQDIPLNVTAIGAERLREGNIHDISRLARNVPGLNVVDFGADNVRTIVLRGMNATRLQQLQNEGATRTTSIYLNDTVLDYSNLDIVDVARVEVLRGPQGTLYGGGAVGGTIRYVTNPPDPSGWSGEVGTGVSDTGGSNATGWETDFILNAPLVQDRLALRLYGGYRDVPGYITKIGYPDRPGLALIRKQDQNTSDRFNARAALRWIMSERAEATIAYNGQRLDTEGESGATPGLGDVYTGVGGAVDEATEQDVDLHTLDLVVDAGFAELTSNTGYFKERTQRRLDGTRFLLELSESAGLGYELFPQFVNIGELDLEQERFTQELRLVSEQGDRFLDYVLGAFYSQEELNTAGINEEIPGLPDFMNQLIFGPGVTSNRPDDLEFVALGEIDTTDWSVFGELTFNLTDRWRATLGGRYFEFDLEGSAISAFPLFEEILDRSGVPGCAPTQPGSDPRLYPCTVTTSIRDAKSNDFVYKLNTSYQFANVDALVFFTVAEGFRRGGANAINSSQTGSVDPRLLGFDPDKATSYELGVKSMLFEDRLRLNASVYHIDWEDIQLQTRVSGFTAILNGNDAQIDGIELEISAQLTDALSLDFNVNRLNAELAEDTALTPDIDGQKGDRLPGSAETQANIAFRYATALSNAMGLWVRLGASYSGDVTTYLNDNQFNQLLGGAPVLSANRFYDVMPSYAVWNLSTGLTGEHWSVAAYADNLFDKAYRVGSSTFELGPVRDPISQLDFYGRPRTIGVNLRYRF